MTPISSRQPKPYISSTSADSTLPKKPLIRARHLNTQANKHWQRSSQPTPHLFPQLKAPISTRRLKKIEEKTLHQNTYAWSQTFSDIRAVHNLRKRLSFEGYPFSRLIHNQVGDGILNSAIAGLAIVAANADPVLAGILVWGTRTVEYGVSVIWNQHMSSQRRQARLAAEGSTIENKLSCKASAAKELVSSCKYDFIAGAATIASITIAIVGGPIGAIIGLGSLIAVCQTMSRFKEMSWGALRYIVNPNPELQKEVVNLQEPMSAYEMAINIGAMTVAYIIGFSLITAFFVLLPEVALPVSIALGVIGTTLMVRAKIQFKEEAQKAEQALEDEQHWSQALDLLKAQFDEKDGQASDDLLKSFFSNQQPLNHIALTDWTIDELAAVYRATEADNNSLDKEGVSHWLERQNQAYAYFYP